MVYPYVFFKFRYKIRKTGKNAYKNEKIAKLYAQNLPKADIFKEISMNIRIKSRK